MAEDKLDKEGDALAVFVLALSHAGMAGVYSNATALMIQGLIAKTTDPSVKGDLDTMLAQVNDVTTWLRASHQQLLTRVQELNLAVPPTADIPAAEMPSETKADPIIIH